MAVITVQVPVGASPGSTIQIVDPTSGTPLQVQVPQGVYSGQTFQVSWIALDRLHHHHHHHSTHAISV